MKMSIPFRALAAVISAMALLGSTQAKNVGGFEEFEGTFKPAGGLISVSGSPVASINATMKVKVPKNGKSAVISISGIAFAGSTAIPVSGTFSLKKSSASTTEVALSTLGVGLPAAGTGKLTGKGKVYSFAMSVPSAPGVFASGTFKVSPQGKKKKKLTLNYGISSGGTLVYTFEIVGSAKVKPSND